MIVNESKWYFLEKSSEGFCAKVCPNEVFQVLLIKN